MSKTLAVAAIKNGTVIDHIPAGQALRIIHLLNLTSSKYRITVGLNLPSKGLGHKDLIKIENRLLTDIEANDIIIFAPKATINIIENFEVSKKVSTRLPHTINKIFICPNLACVTHFEPIATSFSIEDQGKKMQLTCNYCEKSFDRDQVKDAVL